MKRQDGMKQPAHSFVGAFLRAANFFKHFTLKNGPPMSLYQKDDSF